MQFIILLEIIDSLILLFVAAVYVRMPPKKKHEQPDQPILLGRLGTNLKCGIVGLPNVGCVFMEIC